MFVEILIFVVSSVITYLFYAQRKIQSHFEKNGINYKPGVPVFGNMAKSTFLKRHVIEDWDDIYKMFPNDRYVGLIEFSSPVIMIRDPDLIKNITVKDFDHFVDHKEFFPVENEPLFGSSLLMMKGERWREMRMTLTPTFTASKMRHVVPFMDDIAKNIVEHLNENLNRDIDVSELVRRYTTDVIASAGFGLQINSMRDRTNEFYMMGQSIVNFSTWTRLTFMFIALFPTLAKKLHIKITPEKMLTFFKKIVSSTIEFRKKNNIERPDMIQLLMESKREWTLDELTGQVFIFFLAGFDSAATGMVMCVHELAVNPEIQDKLYNEVKEFSKNKQLNYDNINELKYLDCVLNETMRKWSVALVMDRMCTKEYQLPPPRAGGQPYKINPGDIVYNMVNVIHMDPQYFPDPEKFDPERFSEENKHNIKPFTYMPFGMGPRSCIGIRFGLLELKVFMYHLILNFKIVKCSKTSDPIKLQPADFSINAVGGTWVRFEKRK